MFIVLQNWINNWNQALDKDGNHGSPKSLKQNLWTVSWWLSFKTLLSLGVCVQYSNFQEKLMDLHQVIILLWPKQRVWEEGGRRGAPAYCDGQPHQNQGLGRILVKSGILKKGWVRSCPKKGYKKNGMEMMRGAKNITQCNFVFYFFLPTGP